MALPVVVGDSDSIAERARRRSLCGASITTLVLVGSWIVVIWPWRMPIASCSTFTTGARQLVVQDAAVSSRCSRRLIEMIVDADDDVERAGLLHRRRDDHPLDAAREIAVELLRLQELAGAFQHDVAAEIAPGDAIRRSARR